MNHKDRNLEEEMRNFLELGILGTKNQTIKRVFTSCLEYLNYLTEKKNN